MDVFTRVKNITVETLDCDPNNVVNEARFIEDLGADIPTKALLFTKFEEEFELDIADDDEDGLTTIGLTVEYIEKAI